MGEGRGQANGFNLLALLHRVDPLFPQKLCITSSDTDDLGMFKLNLWPSWFYCQPIGASSSGTAWHLLPWMQSRCSVHVSKSAQLRQNNADDCGGEVKQSYGFRDKLKSLARGASATQTRRFDAPNPQKTQIKPHCTSPFAARSQMHALQRPLEVECLT